MKYNEGKGKSITWLRANVGYDGQDCLIWPFALANGYGELGYEGKQCYAHRLMCELVNGPPPSPDHDAAHSCGKGHQGCVHPKHVAWKTRSENQKDRAEHGTKNTWARRGKISPQQADEIRALRGKMKQHEIAEIYGISRAQVCSIQVGRFRTKRLKGYQTSNGRFYTRVNIGGKRVLLGSHATAEAAHAEYLVANEHIRAGRDPRVHLPQSGG